MNIAHNLVQIHQHIADAAKKAGRSINDIHLIAVSKKQSIENIREAIKAGQLEFGENYLQEAIEKITAIQDPTIQWHFIGHIQRNKCKAIAEHFTWAHTIDNALIAERLNQFRNPQATPLQVCIQVNISQEQSKSGIAPNEVLALAKHIIALPHLKLRGLMAIPEATDDFAMQINYFRQLKNLLHDLQEQGIDVDTLSMGMSNDYVAAILEGATYIRIGTAIFGARK